MGSQQNGAKVIRERFLSTFKVMEIHHWKQVEKWKRQGRISMHESEGGEKNFKSLVDCLDFYGLLPPTARAWKGVPTLENFGRKGKNSHQRSLLDFFALAEKSFQLSPVCS